MFKILSTYICWKNIYKMQHLEGSGTPVLYIGRTVLKVVLRSVDIKVKVKQSYCRPGQALRVPGG
jgi:hypothetical protein